MLKSRVLALAPLLLAFPAHALTKPPVGGGGLPPPVIGPSGASKPMYLGALVNNPRSPAMTVTVGWYNTSGGTVTVARSGYGTIGTLTANAGTNTSLVDAHPRVDGQNCYQVTTKLNGTSATSDPICMLTPDGKNRPLWRAQLQVDIADVDDAGTDNEVAVRLDSPPGLYGITFTPSGNQTWIDTPSDDFEQGSHRNYELAIGNLTGGLPLGTEPDVSDVKMISMLVPGSDDATCVSHVQLLLNQQAVFDKTYSPCFWVSPSTPLTVDQSELRASSYWAAQYQPAEPSTFSYDRLDSLATLAVSQQLHGSDESWRDTWFADNPRTSNSGKTYRSYEWAIDYEDAIPLNLQATFAIENTCVNGKAYSRLYLVDVDVDEASYLVLVDPVAILLVDYFAPGFPSLFDTTKSLDTNCDIGLCFTNNGIEPCFI